MPTRVQLIALAAALLFLAGSVGYVVGSLPERSGGSEAEVGFLLDMISHHEQAIEMSKTALSAGMPEGVESFALEVVADQRYETGLMEAYLRRWGHPRQDDDGLAMGWMGHEVPEVSMPGLATAADLERLSDARGAEAAALWLALMTVHHEGGVHMASAAVERVEDAAVRALAERMARVQRIEINEYASARTRLGLPIAEVESAPVPSAKAGGGDHHDG